MLNSFLQMDHTILRCSWRTLLVSLLLAQDVKAASTGAKLSACASMVPVHPATQGSLPAPYTVSMSSTLYGCDESIVVYINSTATPAFRGFLCQARKVWNEYQTYGFLAPYGNTTTTDNCHNNASLTHTDPSDKTSATFTWTAPSYNIGSVYIVCTIVKDFTTHWLNITSPEIIFSGKCSSTTDSQSSTTSTSPSSSTSDWSSNTPSSSSISTTPIPTVSPTQTDSTTAETNTTSDVTFNVTSSPSTTVSPETDVTFTLTSNTTSSSNHTDTSLSTNNVTRIASTVTESSLNTSGSTLDSLSTSTSDMTSGTRASMLSWYRELCICVSIAITHVHLDLYLLML